MDKMKERRRQRIINKELQFQLVRIIFMQAAVPLILLGSCLYIVNAVYIYRLEEMVGKSILLDNEVREILHFSMMAAPILLLITIILVIFLGMQFSHRIAGPLCKLGKNMDRLARGEKVEPVHFRKTDIINGISAKFNAIAKRLGQLKQ